METRIGACRSIWDSSTRQLLVAFLFAPFLLAGCVSLADPSNVHERANEPSPRVTEGHSEGQTFLSHYDNLNSIQVLPVVEKANSEILRGTVVFRLRASAESDVDLAVARVGVSELEHNRPYKFEFSPIADSRSKSYYFTLNVLDDGGLARLALWKSSTDSYVEGSAYVDGQRQTGDLVFQSYYAYDVGTMVGDSVGGAAKNLRLIVSIIALFLLPGYALLALFSRGTEQRTSIPLVIGLSVSIVPVLLFYTTFIGMRLDAQKVFGFFTVLLLFVLFYGLNLKGRLQCFAREVGRLNPRQGRGVQLHAPTLAKEDVIFKVGLAFILVASAAVRLIHLRDLVVPMWVDSVQHAEIVQLIVNRGGVPDSYQPFAEIAPFSYHFGFHALVAVVHWLSGAEITTSMLLVGQALNFAMVLSTYLLGTRLFGGRLAGLASAAVVGLFSTMPAYYTSWGRYTQLTGMVILPIAIVLSMDALDQRRLIPRPRNLVLSALAVGGLIVAHPRVTVFFLCFLVAYVLVGVAANFRDSRGLVVALASCAVVGIAGMVSVAPWLSNMATSLLVRMWEGATTTSSGPTPFPFDYFASSIDRGLIALSAAGLVFAAGRRHKAAIMIALWAGLMLLSANPQLIGLPGAVMVSNGAAAISLFLPISLLVGHLAGNVANVLTLRRWPFPVPALACVLLVVASLFGAGRLAGIMNPSTILFLAQDQAAMEWIKQNTPQDSTFLVNSRLWQFDIFVGPDGGYWIPALTGRKSTMPSLLYALGDQAHVSKVTSLAQKVSEPNFAEGDVWGFLKQQGISYVYIGYRGGALTPETFINKPGFEVVYAGQGVWIFRVEGKHRR